MNTTLTDLVEAAKRATPGPWRHYRGRLRPQFPTIINEVQAVALPAIVPWQGFDDSNKAEKQHRANAAYIALANPAAIIELGRAWDEMSAALEQSQRDLEGARKALKPFAERFDAARDSYAKRTIFHEIGLKNFDKMPDEWPMENLQFNMGQYRAAAKELEGVK